MSQLKKDLEFLADCTTNLLTGFNHNFSTAFSIMLMRKGSSCMKHRVRRPIPYGSLADDVIKTLKDGLVTRLTASGFGVIEHNVRSDSWSAKNNAMIIHDAGERGVLGHVTYMSDPVVANMYIEGDASFVEIVKTWYADDDRKTPSLKRLRYDESNKRILTDIVPLPDYTTLGKYNLAYPYMGETPAELWDAFSKAKSNVLLMIGDVGTGKSSWLRELLDHRGWDGNGYIVDSTNVLMAPCFADFIRGLPQGSMLICEDNDLLTQKRTDGNVHMAALLNATSGLIATSLKLAISTNLNNVDEMDKGIIRPGRLFDTLPFRKLTAGEATALYAELNPKNPVIFEKDASLAEVLNYHESRGTRKCVKTMGFR